jgi:hypothetical protein
MKMSSLAPAANSSDSTAARTLNRAAHSGVTYITGRGRGAGSTGRGPVARRRRRRVRVRVGLLAPMNAHWLRYPMADPTAVACPDCSLDTQTVSAAGNA